MPERAYHRAMTSLADVPGLRLTEPDRLRRLRGEARRRPAVRCARGPRRRGRPGRPDRRSRPARRRGRLPHQRRPRDHRHARLLPAAGRRRPDVRRDRGRERAERRVRDGWPRPVRAVDRGIPRGAAAGRAGRGVRRGVREGPRGRRHAGRRAHDPRPGAEVRAGGHRRGPPRPAAAQGRRPRRRHAAADQAARDRCAGQRRATGPDRRRRPRDRRSTRCGRLNRAAAEVLVANDIRGATDVTGFGLLGHGLEMARASGVRLVFDAAALPALPGALDLARGRRRDRWRGPQPPVRGGRPGGRRRASPPEIVTLAHDPQTSGGLLAAIPDERLEAVTAALDDAGVDHWRVGP